jgi:outer membrane receptor protein involved in Fe transport
MRLESKPGLYPNPRARRLAGVSAAALTLALMSAGVARAADDAASSTGVKEVVVTGSRISRSTFTSPNPVTVINEQEIQKLNLTNAGDIVAQLPQNSNFFAGNNVGLGNFNVGAQLVNLRGLNPFFGTRTLTLLNTERVVPTTTGGGVDITLIPSMLVGRVDTETGGASAVYGSDAIAGVVNIILDNKLEGFKGSADFSQTKYGDGSDYHASVAYGHTFDRGHFIIGGEFEQSDAIGICSDVRDWCATNYALFTNPNFNTAGAPGYGQPHYILGAGGTTANQTTTGLLTPCLPIPGVCINPGIVPQMQFNSSGSALVGFTPGAYAAGAGFFGFQQGGDPNAAGAYETTTMRPDLRKYTGLAHLDYDLTDHIQGSVEGWFARSEAVNPVANGAIGPYALEVGNGVFVGFHISPDNAYLTPAEAGFANALGGGSEFGRNMLGTQLARNQTNDTTYRLAFTLKGDLGGSWGWDAYGTWGMNQNGQHLYHNVAGQLLQYATDAVNSGGKIVCGVTIPGRTNPNTGAPYTPADVSLAAENGGCVPINLFGQGNASQAALDYAFPTLQEYSTYQQEVVSGNVHGDLFQGFGAGPVKLAAGGEWRREWGDVTHDLLNQPWYTYYTLSYGLDYKGTIDVLEGYAELSVPVLKDVPFFKYLEFDGAFRGTRNEAADHSTEPGVFSQYTPAQSGHSVVHYFDTWKVNFLWDVTDWLRLRGTRSRDVRAPQFRELFQSYAVSAGGPFGTITNPWYVAAGLPVVTQTPQITTGGSLSVVPEKADTSTVGIVISPKSGPLQGFNFSADWYQIYINQPIVGPPFGVGAQNIVNLCYQGNAHFCSLIVQDPVTKSISRVNNQAVNLGKDTTRGVDFEADYTLPLDRFGGSTLGSLNFRVLASYLYDLIIDPGNGGGIFNYAGQSGPTAAFGGFNTSPKWQANGFVTYTNGPFSGTVQVRYIGSGRFTTTSLFGGLAVAPGDAGYSTTNANSISANSVPSAWYVNLHASYDVTKNFTVFGNLNNLFNKAPPMAPGGNGYPTNPVYFDTYGMTWKLGVRARF